MKIEKTGSNSVFDLKEVSFAQLKTIRDACLAFAKQGSSAAGAVAAEINKFMDNMTV